MSTAENQSLVRRFFAEVCNGRDLAVADELFAADHAYHDPFIPTGPGPEGMKQVIAPYHAAFSDAQWTVEETIATGDTVVSRWTGHRHARRGAAGIPPTGKRVAVPGIWIHRLGGGTIVESWNNGSCSRWNDREEQFNRLPKVVATRRALMTKKRHATTRSLTTRYFMFIRSSVIGLQRRPRRHSIDQVGGTEQLHEH